MHQNIEMSYENKFYFYKIHVKTLSENWIDATLLDHLKGQEKNVYLRAPC